MKKLPLWVLNNKYPAFYDTESATAIEQTAKVYGAMQELIKEYNAFAEEFNGAVAEFEKKYNADFEVFTTSINQQFVNLTEIFKLKFQELSNASEAEINAFIAEAQNTMNALKYEVNQAKQDMIDKANQLDVTMERLFNQYVATADTKIDTAIEQQNATIAEAENYMKTNIVDTTKTVLTEAVSNVEIATVVEYDSATEALNIEFKVV